MYDGISPSGSMDANMNFLSQKHVLQCSPKPTHTVAEIYAEFNAYLNVMAQNASSSPFIFANKPKI